MVTIKSIAEKLGLSSATVSRVLRNDETFSIPAETRTRIIMTAEEMGYKAPKSRKKSSSNTALYTIIHQKPTFRSEIDSSYYFLIRTGIEDFCQKHKYRCTFLSIEDSIVFSEKPTGIIIVGNFTPEHYETILSAAPHVPIVTIGSIIYHPERIDFVSYSSIASARLGIEYLLENGHRKIGFMGVVEYTGMEQFGSRKQEFIRMMKAAGIYHPEWVRECQLGESRVEQGYLAMKSWIDERTPLPTAIFCSNDPVALGIFRALTEAGLSVPEDISIVSHDGSFVTEHITPAITTVDVHPYQLGFEGAALLTEHLQTGRTIAKQLYLIPGLIQKGSVRKIDTSSTS